MCKKAAFIQSNRCVDIEKMYKRNFPDPAKKRKNGIFKYHTVEETLYGKPYVTPESYDLMEEEVVKMCNLSSAIEERGIEKGIKKGIEEGIKQNSIITAEMMIQDNEPVSKIMKYTRLSFEKLQEIAARFGKNLVME